MSIDAIIDFETLGIKENAVILSVGCIVIKPEMLDLEDLPGTFNRLMDSGFYRKYKVDNQVEHYSRSINKSTIDWWQSETKSCDEAKKVLYPSDEDVDLSTLPKELDKYLEANGFNGHMWTRGMIDGRWLDSILDKFDTEICVKWWDHRDVRTAIDVLAGTRRGYLPKGTVPYIKEFVKHNALCDCANDTIQLALAHAGVF